MHAKQKNPEFDFGIFALQDGLAPWALKLLEIFRNYKKLNIN